MMLKKTSSLFVGNATAESIQNEGECGRPSQIRFIICVSGLGRHEAVIIAPKFGFCGFEFHTELVRPRTVLGSSPNDARSNQPFILLVPEFEDRFCGPWHRR